MVNTRAKNKDTHPGLVDLDARDSQRPQAPQSRSRLSKNNAAAKSEIQAFEKKLLTEQQERSARARKPPGPDVTKQPHTRPSTASQPVTSASNEQASMQHDGDRIAGDASDVDHTHGRTEHEGHEVARDDPTSNKDTAGEDAEGAGSPRRTLRGRKRAAEEAQEVVEEGNKQPRRVSKRWKSDEKRPNYEEDRRLGDDGMDIEEERTEMQTEGADMSELGDGESRKRKGSQYGNPVERPAKKKLTTSPANNTSKPQSSGFRSNWQDDKLRNANGKNRTSSESESRLGTGSQTGYVSNIYGGLVDDDTQDLAPPPSQPRWQSMVEPSYSPLHFPSSPKQNDDDLLYAFTSTLENEGMDTQDKDTNDDLTNDSGDTDSDSDAGDANEAATDENARNFKPVRANMPMPRATLPPTLTKKQSPRDNDVASKEATTGSGGAAARKPGSTVGTPGHPKMPLGTVSRTATPTKMPRTHDNEGATRQETVSDSGASRNTSARKPSSTTSTTGTGASAATHGATPVTRKPSSTVGTRAHNLSVSRPSPLSKKQLPGPQHNAETVDPNQASHEPSSVVGMPGHPNTPVSRPPASTRKPNPRNDEEGVNPPEAAGLSGATRGVAPTAHQPNSTVGMPRNPAIQINTSSRTVTLGKISKSVVPPSREQQSRTEMNASGANGTEANGAEQADAATTEGNENEDVQNSRKRKKAKKYHNQDLPGYPTTLKAFRNVLLPRWYLYISQLDDPWDLVHPDHVALAQRFWDRFIGVEHTLILKDEPVFALLKQRACEWRGEIAKKALAAVEHFFSDYEELTTPEARAEYVAWAVPQNEYIVNPQSKKRTIVPPTVFPYMWETVIVSDDDGSLKPSGAFRHPCILETFAHFLDTISLIPPEIQRGRNPRTALALCTVAVERAFKYWATGELVRPRKNARKFSKHNWGFAAGEVVGAAAQLSDNQWARIRELAACYLEVKGQQTEELLCLRGGISTGRAFCVEEDSN